MNVTSQVLRDAVRIEDVLQFAGDWISAEQFQLPISSRRTYKALRFLQEERLIDSAIEGSGTERFKMYRIRKPGLLAMVLPRNVNA